MHAAVETRQRDTRLCKHQLGGQLTQPARLPNTGSSYEQEKAPAGQWREWRLHVMESLCRQSCHRDTRYRAVLGERLVPLV